MEILNNHFCKLNAENLNFVSDYVSKILTFRQNCEIYQKAGYRGKDLEELKTEIKNTDLWIDAHIKKQPLLHPFRLDVRKKMHELGIEPYSAFIYAGHNHFKQ